MQIKIFNIPIPGDQELTAEMNAFLRSKRILQVENQLVTVGQSAFWSFCLRYLDEVSSGTDKKRVVDYKELLDEESFKRFVKMRDIRKKLAEDEGIPAFAVFTNAELAEMAKIMQLTVAAMRKIEGIGEKKIEKYAPYFITKNENEKDQ